MWASMTSCKTLASLILACFLNFPSIFPSSSCLAEMRFLLLVTTHFPAYHQSFLETCYAWRRLDSGFVSAIKFYRVRMGLSVRSDVAGRGGAGGSFTLKNSRELG